MSSSITAHRPTVAAQVQPISAPAWLPLGAVSGPVLFTLAWLVLGWLSPGYSVFGTWIAPYSPITQPISGLGMGVTGPFMNPAFVLSGLLQLAGVFGIFGRVGRGGAALRWASAVLLSLTPIGLIIAGLFNLESPLMHLGGALLALASPVVSFLVAGLYFRGVPGWRRFGNWLIVASPVTLVLVVLFFATFDQAATAANQGIAGLTQRVLAIELLAWYIGMGWRAFALTPDGQPRPYGGVQMEGPIAAWYARITRGRRDYPVTAQAIARLLPSGGSLLEVAPGPGYMAVELASSYPDAYRITGLDISHSFVRIATENARRAGVAIDFRQGDVAHMPLPSNSFDFVVCQAAFKNFPDPIAALDEMHRVLRSGGRVSIFDLRKDAPLEAIDQEIRDMQLPGLSALVTRWIFRHALLRAAYTRQALESVVTRSKFGSGEIVEDGIGFELRLVKD